MAKRNKFNNDNDISSTTATNKLEMPQDASQPIICNNTNDKINDVLGDSITNVEYGQFFVVENNIVTTDNYVKFIELAKVYNLFNNINLSDLNKEDLICLIGMIIDKMYTKEQALNSSITGLHEEIMELNIKIQELSKKPETSFDKKVDYSDLLGTLGSYKSWN
jgi:hypothetical protein